jgi:hypothetical protein
METTEGVVESPQTQEPAPQDVSTDDLRAALGLTEQPSSAESPEPSPEGGENVIPTETGTTLETEEDRLAKRRIRPRNPEDQQVIDLYRSEGFDGTFAEASQVIYGSQLPPQQAQQPQPEGSDPFEQHEARVGVLQGEIEALETQITEATDNLDTGEALSHQRELMRKEMEIQSINDDRSRKLENVRQREHDAHRSRAMESRETVFEQYPILSDVNGVERKRFDAYIEQAQDNPDYTGVFESPKWPEIMAREFIMSNAPMPQHQQAPGRQAPAMGTQARVLTSGATAQPVNAPLTEGQLVESMPNLSRDDLWSLLGRDDGQRHLT